MNSGSHDKSKKRSIGFIYAWNGLANMIKSERNFQIHIFSAVIVIVIGFIVRLSTLEWSIVLLVIGFVLVTEMVNTAIEKIIDYLKPDIHPDAKMIKDVAAGAVLVSAIIAAIVGFLIFLPKLISIMRLFSL
ncbi:diacylglycerol kinase family protein [Virgibacillus oceani]|uniref:Diacylglycerol kinase n=1 Tax=Virgibacillus oceani TaxID=1479511 RepID=A0A917H110_9BACI|nr:diacylglycerol kinase family protein [Virgibacillus oceani]GGG63401.1 diacylglycerol kinase [Virgibacillus oceani]